MYKLSCIQFGSRSDPTFCWALSGSKLFAVISRLQKSPLEGKELNKDSINFLAK